MSYIIMVISHIYLIRYIISYTALGPVISAVVYGTEIIIGETLVKYKLKTVMIPPPHRRMNNFLCGDQRHVTTIIINALIRCVFTLSPSVFGTTHTHVRAIERSREREIIIIII